MPIIIGGLLAAFLAALLTAPKHISRAQVWNYIAAWALANRDAARVRSRQRRRYLDEGIEG